MGFSGAMQHLRPTKYFEPLLWGSIDGLTRQNG
jgi:hypothetical protein